MIKVNEKISIFEFPDTWRISNTKLVEKEKIDFDQADVIYFTVLIDGQTFTIPYRIYNKDFISRPETERTKFLNSCILTRHHDGYLREKHLKKILTTRHYVTTPFIMQLLGEYVIEILEIINNEIDESLLNNLIKFKKENKLYFEITRQRIYSYWNCYYKSTYNKKSYPGFQILDKIISYEKINL